MRDRVRPSHSKLLVFAVSSCLWILLGTWALRLRRPAEIELVDRRRETERLLLERQIEPRGLPAVALGVDTEERLVREPIDKATANVHGGLEYDPHTVYRSAPDMLREIELPERPGVYVSSTNSSGEREDHDTFTVPLDLFVLTAGDSHTEGVCTNPETWPNCLEARLALRRPGLAVEVLNTGLSGYSLYNYLGVLEKYAPRDPALFVVCSYGGNDFVEVLWLYHFFTHTMMPPQSREYWEEIERGKGIGFDALTQGVNQMLYFRRFPDEAAVALKASFQVCDEIDRQCAARGIEWMFVYIPSVFDGPWPEHAEVRNSVTQGLGLSEGEMRVASRLADPLLAHLRGRGVETIDMREHFTVDGGPWYWGELHIDIHGQQRIAEVLEPLVEAALAARDRTGVASIAR